MSANATTLELREQLAAPGQDPQKVRIYLDGSGSAWTLIYIPIPEASVNKLHVLHDAGVIELDVQPLPEANFRATEMAWLQAHHDEVQHDYPGEWIAVEGQEVVAHAADLPTLLQVAGNAGHPHPFVTLVSAAQPSVPFYGWR